jgi:micrococcal nuclease
MYTYTATVRRVIDGDTIDVDIDLGFSVWLKKQRIRLLYIDAPSARTRNKEEKIRGLLSKEKLKSLCSVGLLIQLKTHKDNKGKFGRILGELLVNDINVNQWLVENNYAVSYFGQSKQDIKKAHTRNGEILFERGEI